MIIPTLNEERSIVETIDAVRGLEGLVEIVIADGGSSDRTVEIARQKGVQVVVAPRGRGSQMRAGAAAARGDVLWFVHADTLLPSDGLAHIRKALTHPTVVGGAFRPSFTGPTQGARLSTWGQPWLRRTFGLVYGDCAMFVRRHAYEAFGGMRDIPIFEDVDLWDRMKGAGTVVSVPAFVTTSSRRFQGRYFRTLALWIALQLLYWMGVSPFRLARMYRHAR